MTPEELKTALTTLLDNGDAWCKGAVARTASGLPCAPRSPNAVSWDLTGALIKAFEGETDYTAYHTVLDELTQGIPPEFKSRDLDAWQDTVDWGDLGLEVVDLTSILAKAGPQSAFFNLNESATLFQDLAGTTTPVTTSGQPLGCMIDLLNGHKASAASNATRAEYWIDPLTSEPVTWYDLSNDLLLWPTIAGAVGTFCVAYSTGAQVFNLEADTHLPPGPMIACYFFDFVLSNAEAAFMKAHMDTYVADDSWLGYVVGTSYTDVITVPSAGVQVHFSVDPTHDSDNWPDMGGLAAVLTLSEARQRFRITVANPSEFNPGNVFRPELGEVFILDLFANETWTHDLYDDVAARVNGWNVSKGVGGANNRTEYGAMNVCQRANPNPIVQIYVSNPTFPTTAYELHHQPLGYSMVFTSALRRVYVYEPGSSVVVFSNLAAPDFEACVNLKAFTFVVENVTGALPTIPASLLHYEASGFVTPQPCPVLPATLKSASIYTCHLTTMPDYSAMSGVTYLDFTDNHLEGVVPSLTGATSGIVGDGDDASYMFDGNPGITGYAGGQIAPVSPGAYDTAGIQVRFIGCGMDQASVDAVLKACLDMNYDANGQTCQCYVHQGTNAAPSALGLTYVAALQALGWTVHHN